jgi:hypothetical protein
VLDGPIADGVAQGIEAWSVEPCAAVSFVAEDMGLVQVTGLAGCPGPQGGKLAVDGLVAFLPFGGHTGVDGDMHDGSPLVGTSTERGGGVPAAAGSASRRR